MYTDELKKLKQRANYTGDKCRFNVSRRLLNIVGYKWLIKSLKKTQLWVLFNTLLKFKRFIHLMIAADQLFCTFPYYKSKI